MCMATVQRSNLSYMVSWMVYVCTFVSSCLATKANNRLLEGCGLLESRPANWGAFDHDAPHVLYYISVCQ